MVTLPFPGRGDSDERRLATTVDTCLGRVRERLDARRLSVQIDMDGEVDPGHTRAIAQALSGLLDLTIERSPDGGELYVSARRTVRGVEVELSEPSDPPSTLAPRALSPCRLRDLPDGIWQAWTRVASTLPTWELYCARCPQGGTAWTVVLPNRMAARRAA